MPLLRANFGFDSRREHHTTDDRDNFSVVFLCRNIVQRIKRSVLRIGYKVAVHFKRGGNPKRTQDFGIPLFVVGFVD